MSKSPQEFGHTNDDNQFLVTSTQQDFPVVLAPLLYPDQCELAPEMSSDGPGLSGEILETPLADILSDVGYNFTVSVEECSNCLMKLFRDIGPATVARILTFMCKTHSDDLLGKDSHGSWNTDIFVQSLKHVAPNLEWKDVLHTLDHRDFVIKDRRGLNMLMCALRMGLRNVSFRPQSFPVDYLYRRWVNVDGQFSLIQTILKNPDIFCFADYPFLSVRVDVLKAPPLQDSIQLANWRNIDLVGVLLSISECGLYSQVQELFGIPLKICPDVLVLTLLQVSGSVTKLRLELLTNLIPIFLGNHPNSATILHHAWHTRALDMKHIIMHATRDWYITGDCDQARLSRILDVAQDLNALSTLLNAQLGPFIIDLACLASRRRYVKLEEWLTDKIREHNEPFVFDCLDFLQRHCPRIVGKYDDTAMEASSLPKETLTTVLLCLQTCTPTVSAECQESIKNMSTHFSISHDITSSSLPPSHETSFGGEQVPVDDSLSGITSMLAAKLNLGGPSSSEFNVQGRFRPFVPSPYRLIIQQPGTVHYPFPLMAVQHQEPAGFASSPVPNINSTGSMWHMGNPSYEKPSQPPEGNLLSNIVHSVPNAIEHAADSYFRQLYNHPPHPTLTIDEVLDILEKFQASPSKHEKQVYNFMLKCLFKECRFFPEFPDRELHITAHLFGGIIERGVVSNSTSLCLALGFVLDALRKPEGSKMYYFGIAALDRFKSRLKQHRSYCQLIRSITHFAEFPPHLIEYVEYGLQGIEPPSKPQGPVLSASLTELLELVNTPSGLYKNTHLYSASTSKHKTTPDIDNHTNIHTLLVAAEKEDKVVSPPESIQAKTTFIFNNLSALNLRNMCDELLELASNEYWPWFSQYLVMKRASTEINFHALYLNLLGTLHMPQLYQMVTKETFRNIKVLLRSDKSIANYSDKWLLKNLGHWLGLLTLGRNKSILYHDLDIKYLMIEAYHKGPQELLYVVPFVAKVLESCAKSRVFQPPNPWTMGIMNLLAELHQEPDLRLEIEDLCKTLNVELARLRPGHCFDEIELDQIDCQLLHANKKVPISQIPSTAASTEETTSEPRFSYMDIELAGDTTLETHILISSSILLFQLHPHLKPLAKTAIKQAVQECMDHSVFDSAIERALITCEQLVKKDYALDWEENRLRSGAHSLLRFLTGGIVMSACRDHLLAKINIITKNMLLSAMKDATSQQLYMIEEAANLVAENNVELTCAFIQKTAIEWAITEIDKRLKTEYQVRKLAKQQGRLYCDSMAAMHQAHCMPTAIRLKVGAATQQQMAAYNDCAHNIPGFRPLSERDAALLLHKPTAVLFDSQSTIAFDLPASLKDEITPLFIRLALEAEQFVQDTNGQSDLEMMCNNMRTTHDHLMKAMCNKDMTLAAVGLIQKVMSLSYDDPPGLLEKTVSLLRDWNGTYHTQPAGSDHSEGFNLFLHQMYTHGILSTDDLLTRFIRMSTQFCVESVYQNTSESTTSTTLMRIECYDTLDPITHIFALLIKHAGNCNNNTTTKINLLNKILGVVSLCLLQDHEQRTTDFLPLPYHRIFLMLFLELYSPYCILGEMTCQALNAYCQTLHYLRPLKVAGFCNAWLELISHSLFIERVLVTIAQQKGWYMYAQLLIDLFNYMPRFLYNVELPKPVAMLYEGTLRLLLLLSYDFPELLCNYHYSFCDTIPTNCIQLRNIILSAFPANMLLPDPFTPNLKIDGLQEIAYAPRVLSNFESLITPAQFKNDLDSYIESGVPVTFLSNLQNNLQSEPGKHYNIPLVNALVMYVGTRAIQFITTKSLTPNMSTIAPSVHMDIFRNLAMDLDTEGRYLFLNAIANQLRYPNSHTHYFYCTLLYLYAETNTAAIQEQIIRVLMERLTVNRPHPWGLLITFIELIKNPSYNFWSHEFVHCAPEIEKLFKSVARSCMVQKTTQQPQEGDRQE